MTICVGCLTLQGQTYKDLNSEERVKALYEITIQHQELTKQVQECQNKYNEEMADYEKRFNQIQSLAAALGAESSQFASHNLDLQAGLLSSLKQQEQQAVKVAKLEKKANKTVGLGGAFGYDPITGSWRAVAGVTLNLIRLF